MGRVRKIYRMLRRSLKEQLRRLAFYRRWERARPLRTGTAAAPAATEFDGDPFALVWTEEELERVRDLLGRVLTVAAVRGIALYPFWGTLLGHVREGRILQWDDDVDLALCEPAHIRSLLAGLRAAGLDVHEHRQPTEFYYKISDPGYLPIAGRTWTFPFVDVFVLDMDEQAPDSKWTRLPVKRELMLPGRKTLFEGQDCFEPERPQAVLDVLYPGWETTEISSGWNHRAERRNSGTARRSIVTDASGRKIVST